MTKIEFKNLPDTSTPLSASNLNTLQDNVENAIDAVSAVVPTLDSSVSTSSTNGVENQAITNYVDGEISDTKDYADAKISNIAGTSQTVGYSQNYINNYVPLKLVQEVHGQTNVSLPNTWNEVVIICTLDGDPFRCLSFTLPYGAPTSQYLRLSYYGDASDNANVGYWYGTGNDIVLGWYNVGGAGQTLSNVRTQIYYR